MSIRVGLTHETVYRYDRPVRLGPQEVRLRPAAHCRTPVEAYSLRVEPGRHFVNWQQDPYGNFVARLVFPEPTREMRILVDLVADLTVVNPFDFFLEESASHFPFAYPAALARELAPFLEADPAGPRLAAWLAEFRAAHAGEPRATVDFLVALNRHVQESVGYIVRMEPGVQSPEETLTRARGSCRDSGWLLVQLLRHLGLAARFVSGYLIQLAPDVRPIDGPPGPASDFTDLHAWAEAYLPGAGWVGLDPTSGLLAGEGHIPLAATALPSSAAPVTGLVDACESRFEVTMQVTRVHEDPRVTRPYTDIQWQAIDTLGRRVDRQLEADDVRLTMGGEPTFVAADDMDGVEWNFTALGERKRVLAGELLLRLRDAFTRGALLHHGQGKWYPGEPLPRWALGLLWRTDGVPLWRDHELLLADRPGDADAAAAQRLAAAVAEGLGLEADHLIAAREDPWQRWREMAERPLARGESPPTSAVEAALDPGPVAGWVLPLRPVAMAGGEGAPAGWETSPWPLRRAHLFLVPGDSPLGLRLPLDSLPWQLPEDADPPSPDPFEARAPLPTPGSTPPPQSRRVAREVIRTALCVQWREGRVHVFLPPVPRLEDFVALLTALEGACVRTGVAVRVEGYLPPPDPRLQRLFVTPDPGVIEVNVHPVRAWDELAANTRVLYEAARLTRLATEKFMIDGRHTGTGGGNHVTVGGPTPADSPLLRRPDLLRSLVGFWQNHPSLSYLFSGLFIGPTSQAPRVDEARDDRLHELAIAFDEMERVSGTGQEAPEPWLVDRLLRHLLTDMTGNTHRAEFSIDKLYSPDGPAGRLGLLEFRAFEMPPHWQMAALQMLLLRALVARFWRQPWRGRLVHWGTTLHDRFLLPHYVAQDLHEVVTDLRAAGHPFEPAWFAPFLEFRFPRYGTVHVRGVEIELRQALEPWHVLGEEAQGGATTRYVDSSVERLQVRVRHLDAHRHVLLCNGRPVPLAGTGLAGEAVAGVRYKAWQPASALHPTIGVHAPLVFDLVDLAAGRAMGGCTYHVMHPGGRNYQSLPVNAQEAEARRVARFAPMGHTPGPVSWKPERPSPSFPLTLDLRCRPEPATGAHWGLVDQ